MRFAYILAICAAVLAVTACDSPEDVRNGHQTNAEELTSQTVYTIDERTHICYAWSRPMLQNSTQAAVPCTPEVLALISNIPREQLSLPTE